MFRARMARNIVKGDGILIEGEQGPQKTPFFSILLYVMGFMGGLALLAWAVAWLLRHR